MAAAKGHVAGPVDGAGKKINNASFLRGADTIHNQAVIAGDADEDDHLLRVVAAGVLQAVPTAVTTVVTGNCKVDEVYFCNTASAVRSVTVQDRQVTPVKLIDAHELPPKAVLCLKLARPRMTSGVEWFANNTGVNGYVIAHQ